MAYKTLLTILRSEEQATAMIPVAAELARRWDAHLNILCLGIDQVQVGYYFAGADAIVQQTSIQLARETADGVLAAAEKLVAGEGIRWSANGVVSQFGALGDVIAQFSRYADLVILPRPYDAKAIPDDVSILEGALFTGQSPVLVIPETGLPEDFGARAVIGWNDGSEALNAVRAALPALADAVLTSIAVVSPPEHTTRQTGPGESLSVMLDRHDVKTEISLLPKTLPRISEVLAQHVLDFNATLLVAGAYGHSRFREAILGGATREILSASKVPVLMAH